MKRTIALLALLTAFPPLSTDMYLPALPALQRAWNQPLVTINLTLITFCFMLIGSGAMGLISLEWTDKITVIGTLAVAVGAVNLAFWRIFSARYQPAPRPPA